MSQVFVHNCEMNYICEEPLPPSKKMSTKLNACRFLVNHVHENLLDKFKQEYWTVFWTLAEQILMKEYVSEQTDFNGMWVRGHKYQLSDVIFLNISNLSYLFSIVVHVCSIEALEGGGEGGESGTLQKSKLHPTLEIFLSWGWGYSGTLQKSKHHPIV